MNVHQIDLRGAAPDAALRAVREAVGPASPLSDSRRVLVLDEAALLPGRHEAYDEILTSGRVERLVCVAVGEPRRSPGGWALRRPGQLGGGRGTVTLWVGDETGAGWTARPPGPAVPHPEATAGAGLARLVDVLRQPEVFDRVAELGPELPDAVASPGLHWVDTHTDASAAIAALARGVSALTGEPRSGAVGEPAPEAAPRGALPTLIAGGTPEAPQDSDPGVLAAARQRLFDTLTGAERALGAVAEWNGAFAARPPARIAADHLPAVGAALADYRDRATELLTRLEGHGGRAPREELAGEELKVVPLPPGAVAEAVDTLRDRVRAALRRGATLPQAAADMNLVASRVRPQGGAAANRAVRETVPEELLASLRDPPRFPPVRPFSRLLLPAFLAPLFPALVQDGSGLFLAVVVAAWLLVLLRLLGGFATRRAGYLRVLALHGTVTVAGTVSGILLGAALAPIAPMVVSSPVVLPLLGVAVAVWAVVGYWRSRARRWVGELGLERARRSATALVRVVERTVWAEYVLGPERRYTADAAVSVAGALNSVAAALAEGVRDLGGGGDRDGDSGGVAELLPPVREDLLELTHTALRPVWRELRVRPVRDVGRRVAEDTSELLAGYVAHLRAEGVEITPPFADPATPRDLPSAGWDLDRSLAALRHRPEGRMLQLCAPPRLALLSPDTGVRAVRFARHTLREALRVTSTSRAEPGLVAPTPPPDTTWTRGGRLAGVLRLVPLRAGTVETLWDTEPAPGEAGSDATPTRVPPQDTGPSPTEGDHRR